MATITEYLNSINDTVSQINNSIKESSIGFDKLQQQTKNVATSMLDAATQTERVTNASKKIEPGAQGFAGGSSGVASSGNALFNPDYNPIAGYRNDNSTVLKASEQLAESGNVEQAVNQLESLITATQQSLDLTNQGVDSARKKYETETAEMNARLAQSQAVIDNQSASKSDQLAAVRDQGFAGAEAKNAQQTLDRMTAQQPAQQKEIEEMKALIAKLKSEASAPKDTGQVHTVHFKVADKEITMNTTQNPEDFIAALERAMKVSA